MKPPCTLEYPEVNRNNSTFNHSRMKRRLHFLPLLIGSIFLLCTSCEDYKNRFDFSRLDKINASGEWGVPVINSDYTAEKLLSQLDRDGFITQDPNGGLILKYEIEKEDIIKASDFLAFQPFGSSYEIFSIDNPKIPGVELTLPFKTHFNFDPSQVIVKNGIVKQGALRVQIETNITEEYSLKIVCHNIKTPNNKSFEYNIASYNQASLDQIFDLSGYSVLPSDTNRFNFEGEATFISGGNIAQSTYTVEVIYSVNNFCVQSAYGLTAPFAFEIDESMSFNLFSHNYGGNIKIYRPKLTVFAKNSFLAKGQFQIDVADLTGDHGSQTFLTGSERPVKINLAASPNSYLEIPVTEPPSVDINTSYSAFKLKGRAIINPDGFDAGVLSLNENSAISCRVLLEVPFRIKVEDAFYRDTVNFSLRDILEKDGGSPADDFPLNIVENAAFRLVMNNGLPFNLKVQLYFFNEKEGAVVDSLFATEYLLPASANNNASDAAPQLVNFNKNRLDALANTDKIIMQFNLNTKNQEVYLNRKNYIKALLGIKLKYDTKEMTL